jgi:DNA repair exonuclease SbcCD ATPase subunit
MLSSGSVQSSPHFHRVALKAFLILSEEERSDLVGTLKDLGVVVSIATLVAEVSKRLDKAPSELEPVIRWFVELSIDMQRREEDAESFADGILQELEFNEKHLAQDERNALHTFRPQLEKHLVAVLSSEYSIATTAKAIDISHRSERVVRRCRITSDIRPVFSDTSAGPGAPLCAVLLHTLRLECAGELQHHHFVLSTSELQQLHRVVERALAKDKVLQAALPSGLTLPVFSDEDG